MNITTITPLTNIYILHGVPLDSNYANVMSHKNATDQWRYFQQYIKYAIVNGKIVRNNVIRLPYSTDQIFDCNYIIFQNTNFLSKYFYAFITNKTAINVNVCEIEIEIDVYETWQFEFRIPGAYIERMHVTDDTFGKHLEPEVFDVSQKKFFKQEITNMGDPYVMAVFWIPQGDTKPFVQGDLMNMCQVSIVPKSAFENFFKNEIQPLIDVGLSDNIIGAVMIPAFVANGAGGYGVYNKTLNRKNYMNLDGYVPANNKLLCYPFNSLVVASQNGLQAEIMLEYFEANDMEFQAVGSLSLDLVIYGDFKNYGRVQSTPTIAPNSAYCSIVSGFPQPLFSGLQSLGYAQATSAQAMNATAGIRSIGHEIFDDLKETASGLSKPFQWVANGLDAMFSGWEADKNRKATGSYDIVSQLPSSTSAWQAFGGEFMFLHKSIPRELAYKYDSYLTRFGYNYSRYGIPNLNTREIFNYVKTSDIVILGELPQEDRDKIASIFNSGVTIWHQERAHYPGSWNGAPSTNPNIV